MLQGGIAVHDSARIEIVVIEGIFPSYHTLHQADRHFSRERHVCDVLHYADSGKAELRVDPFIIRECLPLLKPKDL